MAAVGQLVADVVGAVVSVGGGVAGPRGGVAEAPGLRHGRGPRGAQPVPEHGRLAVIVDIHINDVVLGRVVHACGSRS